MSDEELATPVTVGQILDAVIATSSLPPVINNNEIRQVVWKSPITILFKLIYDIAITTNGSNTG
jgi:hypothetical protein